MRLESRLFILCCCSLLVVGAFRAQSKGSATGSPDRPLPRSAEILQAWNEIGNKLIDVARDFPENKYDFKVQKDQRTFAETLLHVAGMMYQAASEVKGTQVGPAFDEMKGPVRHDYKTKAAVVKLLTGAVAAGAAVIKSQGDAALDKPTPSPFTADPIRTSTLWWGVIEQIGEHYGQLAVYYRANNLVPPASRLELP